MGAPGALRQSRPRSVVRFLQESNAMTYARDAVPPYYHGTRADLATIPSPLSSDAGVSDEALVVNWY